MMIKGHSVRGCTPPRDDQRDEHLLVGSKQWLRMSAVLHLRTVHTESKCSLGTAPNDDQRPGISRRAALITERWNWNRQTDRQTDRHTPDRCIIRIHTCSFAWRSPRPFTASAVRRWCVAIAVDSTNTLAVNGRGDRRDGGDASAVR